MGVLHLGQLMLAQGAPAPCGTFSPQRGQTQLPPGPAPALLPPFDLGRFRDRLCPFRPLPLRGVRFHLWLA